MQRIIQQITQQFVDRLPENEQYYRLDELRSWDFPSFIIRRIKIELERNMAESMIIPKTDWANTQSAAVVDAWQKFVDAIRAEARLPASYGKTVIETAVADVVEMLVQPRKNIPSVIFGSENELNRDEIHDRLKAIVVYPHFAKLILRYMQKKEMDKLTKERCAKIVSDADEKLTSGYSPLNWAQMLEPLFKLVDGDIDTNLLRLFFEDKKMPRIARKFDLMNDALSRAELIEVLSSPDLLDFEGYKDEQSSLFDGQPKESKEPEEKQVEDEAEPEEETTVESDIESKPETSEETEDEDLPDKTKISDMLFPEERIKKGMRDGGTLNSNYARLDELSSGIEEFQDEDGSLNAIFRTRDRKDSKEESVEGESDKEPSEDGEIKKSDRKSQKVLSDSDEQAETKEEDHLENGKEKPAENEKTPIWMRYMTDEEAEEYEKHQETDDDGFIDDPIIDLTKEDASDEEIATLKKMLKSDREFFVDEIFRGSERAFDEAVEDIAAYDSWRNVSKYIEKDVFKRNLVDMYSEAAVDFTDRLQSYFLEKQNQNK